MFFSQIWPPQPILETIFGSWYVIGHFGVKFVIFCFDSIFPISFNLFTLKYSSQVQILIIGTKNAQNCENWLGKKLKNISSDFVLVSRKQTFWVREAVKKKFFQEYFLNREGAGGLGISKLYVIFWWPLFLANKCTFLFLNLAKIHIFIPKCTEEGGPPVQVIFLK